MSLTASSSIPQHVVEKFIKYNQLKWEDFTPERIASVSQSIDQLYVPGLGIQASDICRIFFIYNQSRKKYEGICFHLFNLVATKDGKGHIYFVKTSDIGNTEFPVIPSKWHNLDRVVSENYESSSSNSVSKVRSSLESQWSNDSVSSFDKSALSSALSALTTVCSQLSKVLSKIIG